MTQSIIICSEHTENYYVNSYSNLNQIKFYFERIIRRQNKKDQEQNLYFRTETENYANLNQIFDLVNFSFKNNLTSKAKSQKHQEGNLCFMSQPSLYRPITCCHFDEFIAFHHKSYSSSVCSFCIFL